jgi:hypothetical protein
VRASEEKVDLVPLVNIEGINMKKLLCFIREGCINCPAAKEVVREILDDETCRVSAEFINADEITLDLQYRLLEGQIFIFAVPTIVLEDEGKMTLISSGDVPTIAKLKRAVC